MTARQARAAWTAPLALAAIGVALVLHAVRYDFLSDDALIIGRYARNVVEGHGWVFNPGEYVEGYTSFLWTALVALLGSFGVDFVVALRGLSLLGALGCLVVLYFAMRRAGEGRVAACAAPALVAATSIFACWALGGLETCGYALAVLGTLVLADPRDPSPRRLVAAGCAAGACVLLRPDGALVAIGVALTLLVERPARRARSLALFLGPAIAIAGAHLLWRRAYYDSWLPNTAYAKVGFELEQVRDGLRYLAAGFGDHGGLPLWIVPFAGAWLVSRDAFLRLVSIVGLLLLAGVALVGGDGLPMYRFLVPVVPLWALLVTRLAASLARLDFGEAAGRRRAGQALAVAGMLALGVAVLARPTSFNQYVQYRDQKTLEVPRWRAAGEWLARNAPPGASVACVPIGAIGYYSGLRLYDMLGLTDRHIARRPIPQGGAWAGHAKHDGPYILSREPTYLLLGNVQVLEEPLPKRHPYFGRPPVPAIRQREADMFTPELAQRYERRVAALPDGLYLHYFQRKGTADPG